MLIRSGRGGILRVGSWFDRLSAEVSSSMDPGASARHWPVADDEPASTDAGEPYVPGFYAFHAELGGTFF